MASRAPCNTSLLDSLHRPPRTSVLVILLLCWSLSTACSTPGPAVPSTTASATPLPTPAPAAPCTVLTPVSAPLFTGAKLQTLLALPGSPFASVATHSGQWIFVSLQDSQGRNNGIAVLRHEGASTAIARIIPLPGTPSGLVLTSDEQLLLVADGIGVAVLDATKAEAGTQDVLLHLIADGRDPGTVEVAISRDDQFVFATDESGQTLSVIDLAQVRRGKATAHGSVGRVPLDPAPVGLALSPDNRYLYVTTEYSTQDPSVLHNPSTTPHAGTLTVVDVAHAEHDSAHAVVGMVLAGCSPVRVALSAAGDVAWVTARGGNALLAFNTARLISDPAHALIASLAVGSAPVGLAVIRQDAQVVVANSNREAEGRSPQTLTLIDAKLALAGRPALVGALAVGSFPRELALDGESGETLLLTNYTSATLSLIDLSQLPRPSS